MHNTYDKGSGYDENDGFIDNTEAVSTSTDNFGIQHILNSIINFAV